MSLALAAWLLARGLVWGDRVAVMLRNRPAAIATVFALARAGYVWVPVNVQQRGEGLRYILDHCAPSLLIAEADLLEIVIGSGASLARSSIVSAEALDEIAAGSGSFEEAPPAPDDLLAISYTSGTTGPPKGVQMTHRMLRLAGEGAARVADIRDGDVLFHWEPLYHIGGSQMLIAPLLRRVHLAMVDRFSARSFWPEVIAAGATHMHYLGGILQILLKQPPSPLDRAHKVRVAWGGGAPANVWTPFRERFGIPLHECYGMTEASSISTCNTQGVVGAVGWPVPWFSVDLLDSAGRSVPKGERGEIVISTSQPGAIFPGYFRNPEATARALRDGALYTGDLGSWGDDGALRFHGRMTDNVRVRGENISAWEIEHVVAGHPNVEDCAIVGVTAEIGEQDIKLFVQAKPGAQINPAELCAWAAVRLAAYQLPRYIAVVSDFERTPSQRIMKHRLARDTAGCWDRHAPS